MILGLSEHNARKRARLYCQQRGIEPKSPLHLIEDTIMAELKSKKLTNLGKTLSHMQMICDWMWDHKRMSYSLTSLFEFFFHNLKETFLKCIHDTKEKMELTNY